MAPDAGAHQGQPHPRRGVPLCRARLVPALLRLPGGSWLACMESPPVVLCVFVFVFLPSGGRGLDKRRKLFNHHTPPFYPLLGVRRTCPRDQRRKAERAGICFLVLLPAPLRPPHQSRQWHVSYGLPCGSTQGNDCLSIEVSPAATGTPVFAT